MRASELSPDLFAQLRQHVPAGSVISTLSTGTPNHIVALTRTGVDVETERSASLGSGPQQVPAWMIHSAWDRLHTAGRLSSKELLATDDLTVKRSSFVCALLARLPGVEVISSRPIVLEMSPTTAPR